MKKIQAAAQQQSYTRFLRYIFYRLFQIKIKCTGGGRTPDIFCSLFSQNPELYLTYLLYTFIYYIFGCAARAVDLLIPNTRFRLNLPLAT